LFRENIKHEAWVKRDFRLTRSTDLKRVRKFGKSYAHPLIVLVAIPATEDRLRDALQPLTRKLLERRRVSKVAVTAARSVGGAIQRNRAKRLLRESMRALIHVLRPGWEIVLIARQPLAEATLPQVQAALSQLLRRADLLLAVEQS
jgi:ribonuclease P protein component